MARLRNITRGLGAIPRQREPGLFDLPIRPPSIQQLPPVNIGGPVLPRMKPPVIPPRPPSIGGVGGINQDFIRDINPNAPPQNTQFDTNLRNQLLGGTPPKRNDFMSISRDELSRDELVGDGIPKRGIVTDMLARSPVQYLANSAPFVPPQQPAFTPLSERTDIYGEGKKYDPANLPEGFSYDSPRDGNNVYSMVMPSMGNVYAYGPDGQRIEVASGIQSPGFNTTIPGGGYLSDLYNPGTTPPMSNDIALPPPERIAKIGDPIPVTDPVTQPAPVQPAPTEPAAVPTTQSQQPFASNVVRSETGLDATTKQLLFGLDGKGGFIPGAMRAAERTFFDEQGNPIVIPEQVAGLSPDQLRAQELARMGVGIQDPYLQEAGQAYRGGIDALDQGLLGARMRGEQALDATRLGVEEEQLLRDRGLARTLGGLDRAESIATGATDQFGRRLADVERLGAGAAGRFGTRLGGIERSAAGDVGAYGGALGESEALLRDTLGGYDPSMTQQFMDPYEQAVVDQTSKDIFEQFAKSDIGARASDIARGGQSAFGSRARLGAGERTEALGRGLAEALSGIRSRGFQQAQQTGLGEFARQQAARRAASSGLGSIAGSRLGAQRGLTDLMTSGAQQRLASEQGVVDLLGRTGQQQLGAQTGLGSTIAGYGTTAGSALGGAGQAALGSAGQLAGAFGNLSGLESQIGQQRQAARFGLGAGMQGLGSQAQGARAGDVSQLYGLGQGQQQLTQAQLDAARRNALTAQQAPLAQYQALAPFVSMAPAGQFQTQTTFAPSPSPLQAGLGVGLSTLGAVGNFMNQGKT